MNEKVFGLILAGGSGSRLWPLSREMFPKQLLKLYENVDETLFQQAVKLLNRLIPAENLLVITNNKYETDLSLQYKDIYSKTRHKADPNILIEPVARNTAPAIAVSLCYILKNYNVIDHEAIIIATPADHYISDKEKFIHILEKAIEIARKDYIVTIGIKPEVAETGYGYIKTGGNLINETVFAADRFIEKPDAIKAREYMDAGNYYWNSGLYVFKASILLEELKKHSPDIYKQLDNLTCQDMKFEYEQYAELPDISIDNAVMEKSEKIAVIPADVGWSDLGSWKSVYEKSIKDPCGNFISGNVLSKECANNLIYGSDNLIAAIGLNNLYIVSTEDATLICDAGKTQEVKHIVQELKQKKDATYKIHKTQLRPWGYMTTLKEEQYFKIRSVCIKPE